MAGTYMTQKFLCFVVEDKKKKTAPPKKKIVFGKG